jgi:uncharacterized SAM-binding protein YcdF (DUF218 family)
MVAGALVGALVAWLAWTRIVAYVAIAVASCVALVTLTPVIDGPVRSWIRRDPLPTAPLDAVAVLSASVNRDGALDVSGVERLLSGLDVFRRTHARLLITTRIVHRTRSRTITSDADQRRLIALATDTSVWRIVAPVHTTHDEALRTAELLAPASARTIAVVTSPLHTRRACATFEGVGFRVVCVPSEERRYAAYSLSGPMDRLRAFFDLLYERLGMIEYRTRGWVRTK